MTFHSLEVSSIKNLTNDSVQISFDVPAHLKAEFQYTAGQYITLDINGERRDYSLCASPLDGQWTIGVKKIASGKVSRFLTEELKVGDKLTVSTPNGRFGIPSKPNEKRTILSFAAGSGITPILSIAKYTLQTEEWVNFYLFFSNKTPETVMFMEEIQKLKEQFPKNFHPHLFYTQHKLENWLFEGRLNAHKFELILNQLVDINEVDEALVCGPNEMIKEISQEIFNAGIPKKHIHFELFAPDINPDEIINDDDGSPEHVSVTVQLDGEVSTIEWHREKNLIDSLHENGVDAPYSCKGGICSSCMCRMEEGEVNMAENFVLTDSDVEEGLFLPCISRPKSNSIKINFDNV